MDSYYKEDYRRVKESICSVYCGNLPSNCKRDCIIREIDLEKARKIKLKDLFVLKPTKEAIARAREIRLAGKDLNNENNYF